jgi:hypothetical protein
MTFDWLDPDFGTTATVFSLALVTYDAVVTPFRNCRTYATLSDTRVVDANASRRFY